MLIKSSICSADVRHRGGREGEEEEEDGEQLQEQEETRIAFTATHRTKCHLINDDYKKTSRLDVYSLMQAAR